MNWKYEIIKEIGIKYVDLLLIVSRYLIKNSEADN